MDGHRLDNFNRLFHDPLFWQSAYNTLYYTALAVPIGVVVAIVLALAMNQRVKEVSAYRAILYLPTILPLFALSFVWIVFVNPRYGMLSYVLNAGRRSRHPTGSEILPIRSCPSSSWRSSGPADLP